MENQNAIIIDIVPKWILEVDLDDRLCELENLVNTYWSIAIIKKIQKKDIPNYKTYIWTWKLEEIANLWKENNVSLLIIWNMLKSQQLWNVNKILKKHWDSMVARDRVDLILKIFDKHATSPEARLQIELAAIKHLWPRIFGMWFELSRQWGGIWTKWIWETNTEIMKRHLQFREKKIIEKLKKYENTRELHRNARTKKNLKTIWIVWYTNVWKSSLLNKLTKKWALAENKLFATLGTNVWKAYLSKTKCEVLINDTIWFIRDLPPNLIKAFASTLEDSIKSQWLIHLIDSSDPKIWEKIEIVDNILDKIWASQPKIYVFNKIDLISKYKIRNLKKKFQHLCPIFISTEIVMNLDHLKDEIGKLIEW